MHRLNVPTERREQLVDITRAVADAAAALGVSEGAVLVYSPHTTAGVTINEEYDPDVAADVLDWMATQVPHRGPYAHAEGNSDSHIKAIIDRKLPDRGGFQGPAAARPVAGGVSVRVRWPAPNALWVTPRVPQRLMWNGGAPDSLRPPRATWPSG